MLPIILVLLITAQLAMLMPTIHTRLMTARPQSPRPRIVSPSTLRRQHLSLSRRVRIPEDGRRARWLRRVVDGGGVLGGEAVADAPFGHRADGAAWVDGGGGVWGGRGAAWW